MLTKLIGQKSLLTVYLLVVTLILGLIGSSTYWYSKAVKYKEDSERNKSNFFNVVQQMDSVVNRDKSLSYSVNSLNLEIDELKQYNNQLIDEIKNMKLKKNRVQTITQLQTKIEYKIDTVWMQYDTTNTSKEFAIENQWIQNSFKIDDNLVYDYELAVRDSIVTLTEITYKGWWIFKKPKGIKLHVKSFNPYSNFERIEYIQIKK